MLVLGCTASVPSSQGAQDENIPTYETQSDASDAIKNLAEGLDTISNDLNSIDSDVT